MAMRTNTDPPEDIGVVDGAVDAHLHVVDFLQRPMTRAELIEATRVNSGGVVVFGLPVKKKWGVTEPQQPTYYLDDNAPCSSYSLTDVLVMDLVQSLPTEARAAIAPLICGFDPTDQLATDHIDLMAARSDAWRGIGEVLLRHDDLTEMTYGENARADHPALDHVLEICRSRAWPFTFHQDASSAGRSGEYEYVAEVRRMAAAHPQVPMVWAHAGASRRVSPRRHAGLVQDMLETYPNLHVDLSWVIVDRVLDEDLTMHPQWRALMSAHPDRFILGSDAFGSLDAVRATLPRRQAIIDALAPSAAELVAAGNARRLWWHT